MSIKYIYVKDQFGEMIGYIREDRNQSKELSDVYFVHGIAMKSSHQKATWKADIGEALLGVRLNDTTEHKIYENREDFFSDFYEVLLQIG